MLPVTSSMRGGWSVPSIQGSCVRLNTSGIESKAFELQVPATEAKNLAPVVCGTVTCTAHQRSRDTPTLPAALEGRPGVRPTESATLHLKSPGQVTSQSDSGFLVCKVGNISIDPPEWL